MLLELEIITAERVVYVGEVDALIAPGLAGELGILPNHASLMTVLQPGECLIRENGQDIYLAIGGGFLEVIANKATILADSAERAEEIDLQRASAAMKRGQERIAMREPDLDLERAVAALRRANIRMEIAKRRRVRSTAFEDRQ